MLSGTCFRSSWARLFASAIAATGGLTSAGAQGQCEPQWLVGPGQGAPGANGPVSHAFAWDPDGAGPRDPVLAVAGLFDIVGNTVASGVATFDGSQWHDLAGGVSGGTLFSRGGPMAEFDGDLILGGHFPMAGGVTVNNIARWDGSQWHPLGGGVGGTFFAEPEPTVMARFGDRLIAGGNFDTAGGQPVGFIASWDGQAWNPLGAGLSFVPMSMAVFSDELYVGGAFQNAAGVPNTRFLARWDGSQWKSIGSVPTPSGFVVAMAQFGGHLYVAGQFSDVGIQGTVGIARWNGASWSSVGGGLNGPAFALHVHNGSLHVTGNFGTAGGKVAAGAARWDGTSWHALAEGLDGPATGMATLQGNLFAVGDFDRAGTDVAYSIARWNGSAWSGLGDRKFSLHVGPMALHQGKLVTAGLEDRTLAAQSFRIAQRDGDAWTPLGGKLDETVWTLRSIGGQLYAGGWFSIIGDESFNRIACWDGSAWQPLGTGVSVGASFPLIPSVLDIIEHAGQVHVAGDFLQAGGQSASLVARWDGSAWHPLGTGLGGGSFSTAYAMAVLGNQLIAAGEFSNAGSTPTKNIARWDGSAWHPLGSGIGFSGVPFATPVVRSLAVHEGSLFAAGDFNTAGGSSALNIARWDGSTWSAVGAGLPTPFATSAVFDIVSHGGDLFAAGSFTAAAGGPGNRVARWDGSDWHPLGSGVDQIPVHLTSVPGELNLAGNFFVAGGQASMNWARYGCPSSACYADCDLSGSLTIFDYICFGNEHAAQSAYGDCDESGTWNIFDFICFSNAFAAGCP